MTTKQVINMAAEAVAENFANYDWCEAAEMAAIQVESGDTVLAAKIAMAAKKLPAYAKNDDGITSVFLFWENLQIKEA